MSSVRLSSVTAPFDSGPARLPATRLVLVADGLGLLPGGEAVERLDVDLVRDIARRALAEGVAQEAALAILADGAPQRSRSRWKDLVQALEGALEASPMPERELTRLLRTYGHEALGRLLFISPASLRRYVAGQRTVPDAVAARIHFIALVTADLAGSYNDFGLRRWWERPRSALDDRSPRAALGDDWGADGPAARAVAGLARSLAGPGAAT
jgi:hypothetical protein